MGGTGSKVRDCRWALAERLRENSAELEEAVFDRICALEDSASRDPHQLRGVRSVVRSALRYGIDSVELGEQRSPRPPPAVADHARKAAWSSVPLQTLYDRYFAGYAVFKHFLLQESDSMETARQAQGTLDVVFQRLIRVIAEEHSRELQKRSRSSDLRRLERVEELLSRELLEAPDLQYPFGGMHVGIVVSGAEIPTIRHLLRPLGSQVLHVNPAPHRVWAWVSVRQELRSSDLAELLPADLPSETCVSIGEPAEGLAGWRLTHRQALAARSVALGRDTSIVQFSSVALVATALGDELLLASLVRQYLNPLDQGRDGGKALRETLRAYFSTNRHISSAASLLGVKRHTVSSRLQAAEERLGCSLSSCAAELEVALRLEDLV